MRLAVGLCGAIVWVLCCQDACGQDDSNAFVPPSSDPEKLIVANDVLLFTAEDGVHGREWWKYDVETDETRLVRDITPGPNGTDIGDAVVFEKWCLFGVQSPEHGNELWKTDGTEAGTVRLKRFEFGPDKGLAYFLTAAGDQYFFAVEQFNARRLWRTDGTPKGTRPVFESISASTPIVERPAACSIGDILLFSTTVTGAATGTWRSGLWRSDGTPEGTFEVSTVPESPESLVSFGARALFKGATAEQGHEVWITDGTKKGTHLFCDIVPGPGSGSPKEFYPFDDRSLFAAWRKDCGLELWCATLSTKAASVIDIEPGPNPSDPYAFTRGGQWVYFVASNAAFGRELWRSDGTKEGTVRLTDSYPGPANGEPYALCALDTRLIFSINSDRYGEELWVSGGEPGNTHLIKDIAEGPMSSSPYGSVLYKGIVYFAASHPLYGRELWRTNGTPEGTALVSDIYNDLSVNPSSTPEHLTSAGGKLFFVANDIRHGAELWCSDGTKGGTYLVRDIYPGRPSSDPRELTAVDDMVYFSADDGTHGLELWRSDGTKTGTSLVEDIGVNISSAPKELTAFGHALVFVARREQFGEELWIARSDGTHLIKDIAPGPLSSKPGGLAVWEGRLYFRADDGVHGEELWSSDGTEAGTAMVKDLVPVPYEGASIQELTPSGDRLFFAADDGVRGRELWVLSHRNNRLVSVLDLVTMDDVLGVGSHD